MRIVRARGYGEARDALSHDWVRWSEERGAIPMAVPNALSDFAPFLDQGAPRLIVLTGGNDAVAGGPGGDAEPIRDRCEHALLDYAAARDVPVLAVCRGMHILNLHFGGHVVPVLPDSGAGHVGGSHQIRFEPDISCALGRDRAATNSFHRQGVARNGVAPALRVAATCARDGFVEALIHPSRRMIGIQWHPERPNPASDVDGVLLDTLLCPRPFWVRTP